MASTKKSKTVDVIAVIITAMMLVWFFNWFVPIVAAIPLSAWVATGKILLVPVTTIVACWAYFRSFSAFGRLKDWYQARKGRIDRDGQ